jgi:hypothetical protein
VVPEDTRKNETREVVVKPPEGEGAAAVVVEIGEAAPCKEESKSLIVLVMV